MSREWARICLLSVQTFCFPQQPVVGVLDEPDSAKPAQLRGRTGPLGYIHRKDRMDIGHGSRLCRQAGLYGYSAERG